MRGSSAINWPRSQARNRVIILCMDIHVERLIYVIPAGIIACWLLDRRIWKMNLDWLKKHPTKPRHPYSPLFTAFGVTITCTCLAAIIPWQYAALCFGAFCIFGGFMWILHSRRWWMRN